MLICAVLGHLFTLFGSLEIWYCCFFFLSLSYMNHIRVVDSLKVLGLNEGPTLIWYFILGGKQTKPNRSVFETQTKKPTVKNASYSYKMDERLYSGTLLHSLFLILYVLLLFHFWFAMFEWTITVGLASKLTMSSRERWPFQLNHPTEIYYVETVNIFVQFVTICEQSTATEKIDHAISFSLFSIAIVLLCGTANELGGFLHLFILISIFFFFFFFYFVLYFDLFEILVKRAKRVKTIECRFSSSEH